jgi:hypothetical protein
LALQTHPLGRPTTSKFLVYLIDALTVLSLSATNATHQIVVLRHEANVVWSHLKVPCVKPAKPLVRTGLALRNYVIQAKPRRLRAIDVACWVLPQATPHWGAITPVQHVSGFLK